MTLVFVFALDAEWSPWRARHAFRPAGTVTGNGHIPVYEARIGHTDVRVVVSGLGPARAAAAAPLALAGPVDALLATGFAGGLRSAYRAAEVIAARRVQMPSPDARAVSDERLVALAANHGATIVDSLLTVDHLVTTAEDKLRLGRDHAIVDRESFPLLAAAAARGVPAMALRVVSNTASEDIPPEVLHAMRPDGSIIPKRFFWNAALRPWRWPALARLVRAQGESRQHLVDLLDRLVTAWPTDK